MNILMPVFVTFYAVRGRENFYDTRSCLYEIV